MIEYDRQKLRYQIIMSQLSYLSKYILSYPSDYLQVVLYGAQAKLKYYAHEKL